jgi:O-antigen/teichoic acid export membrane protein
MPDVAVAVIFSDRWRIAQRGHCGEDGSMDATNQPTATRSPAQSSALGSIWLRRLSSFWLLDLLALATFVWLTPRLIVHFGAAEFGMLAVAQSLVGYLGLVDLGLRPSLSRMVTARRAMGEEAEVHRLLSTAFAWLAPAALLVGCAAWWAAGQTASRGPALGLSEESAMRVAPFLGLKGTELAVELLLSPLLAANAAGGRLAQVNLLRAGHRLVGMAAGVATVVYALPLTTLALASLVATAASAVAHLWMVRRDLPGFFPRPSQLDRAHARELLGLASQTTLGSMVMLVAFRSDALVIAGTLGTAAVALYAPLFQWAETAMRWTARIGAAVVPEFTAHVVRQESGPASGLYGTMLERSLLIALLGAIPVAAVGELAASRWLGGEVPLALTVMLALLLVVHLPVSVSARYQLAQGRLWSATMVSVASGLLNLGLSLLLVRPFGLAGVAAGTVISQAVTVMPHHTLAAMRGLGLTARGFLLPLLARVLLASIPMVVVAGCWRWSWLRFGEAAIVSGALATAVTGLMLVWLAMRRG